MKTGLIVIVVLVLIALVAFGQYVGVRNTLVTKNEGVKAAWSQVDIVLQRRADLIPNLVETVKGIAGQEQGIRRHCSGPFPAALGQCSRGQNRCQPATGWRHRTFACGSGELPAIEIK